MNLIPIVLASLSALQTPPDEALAGTSPLTLPIVMQVVGDQIISELRGRLREQRD